MEETNPFTKGLFWGISLSIPLWISMIGWVEILHRFIF